jgi:hypothetical protein
MHGGTCAWFTFPESFRKAANQLIGSIRTERLDYLISIDEHRFHETSTFGQLKKSGSLGISVVTPRYSGL